MKIIFRFTLFLFMFLLIGCGTSEDQGGEASDGQNETDNYPEKPIEMTVPYGAGGGTDLVARSISAQAEEYLGQPINVVNREGAAGAVGLDYVHGADPDGYNFIFHTSTMFGLKPYGTSDISGTEMEPVAEIVHDPVLLVVPAESEYESVEEVLQEAKENPGKLNIGSGGVGTVNYNGVLLLEREADVEFNITPITSGGAEQMARLVGNQLGLGTMYAPEISEQVEAGEIRILAAMSDERLENHPDVPTFQEIGYDVTIASSRLVLAPPGTPKEYIETMKDALVEASKEDEFIEYVENSGTVLRVITGEELEQRVKDLEETYESLAELAR